MDYSEIFIGSDLPKPLKQEEFLECIKKARSGDYEARDKVIMHNIRLVLNRVMKKNVDFSYDLQELVSIGVIGLIKAVDTFNIEKNIKFVTYASKCIDNEILMFFRKEKYHLKEESLDETIIGDGDDKKLKILDVIVDENSDFVFDVLNKELFLKIREIVENLYDNDKRIIKLYFGFYDGKRYSQKEISDMLGISRSYVSRKMSKAIDIITKKLEEQNLIEKRKSDFSSGKDIVREEGLKEMSLKLQTIYEYFGQYSREQINNVLNNLSAVDRELITLRYGYDLDYPETNDKWTKEDNKKFYGSLIPKIRRLLEKQNKKEIQIEKKVDSFEKVEVVEKSGTTEMFQDTSKLNNINKEDCLGMLNLLKTTTFNQMLGVLSLKEAVIISLRLGLIDGKYFSTGAIASFLDIDETEVRDITTKVLLLYKQNINEIIDTAIEVNFEQSKSLKF